MFIAFNLFVNLLIFFFFNDTATTEIYTLSLHDALPICRRAARWPPRTSAWPIRWTRCRSEEHTSELQSLRHLVCRLLLEKKKNNQNKRRLLKKKTKIKHLVACYRNV